MCIERKEGGEWESFKENIIERDFSYKINVNTFLVREKGGSGSRKRSSMFMDGKRKYEGRGKRRSY